MPTANVLRVALASALLCAHAAAQANAPAAPAGQPDPRPAFRWQRHDENWSAFRAEFGESKWLLDPFKHLPLDDSGEWWLSIGGRIDTRTEWWDGFGFGATTPGNSDAFLLSRIHLHADAHLGEHARAFVEARTAQVTDRNLPGGARDFDLDTFDLYNAFVDLSAPACDGKLTLRTGRQSLSYGAQRLVSPLPWVNAWRTFEGVSALWRSGRWSVDAFLTALVVLDRFHPNERDDEKQLYGVYATRAPEQGGLGVDLYILGNTRSNVTINGTSGDERRHTAGLRAWSPWAERGDFEFEGAWQFGEVGGEDVAAWFGSTVVGYRVGDSSLAPRVFVGLDAASGDRTPGGSVQTFNQLYPLGHAYFGLADVLGRQNLLAVNIGCSIKPTARTTATLTAHVFQLLDKDDGIYAVNGALSRSGPFNSADVGQEFDLYVTHSVTHFFSVYGGYSRFFSGQAVEEGAVSDDIDFLYFGTALTF